MRSFSGTLDATRIFAEGGLSQLESSVPILSARTMHRAAISEALSASIATVSTYRPRAIKKLRASDVDEAVRIMREEGGLDID